LVHSVYSTSFFGYALFSLREREKVRRLVGRESEALAYLFCVLDRASLCSRIFKLGRIPDRLSVARHDGGRPIRLSRAALKKLLLVECANTAEQTSAEDGGPAPWMSNVLFWLRLTEFKMPALGSSPAISNHAEQTAIAVYSAALHSPADRAIAELSRVAALNPFAAEPRILRGLCALELGDPSQALLDAVRGQALLTAWAIPWDKRLSLATWCEISSGLSSHAGGGGRLSNIPTIASMGNLILAASRDAIRGQSPKQGLR